MNSMHPRKHYHVKVFLAFIIMSLAVPVLAGDARVPAAPNTDSVKNRLGNVERLVNISSGADRIRSSGNTDAENVRLQAASYHADAQKAFDKGDIKTANDLLGKATMSMFKAMRMAGSGAALKGKYKDDYTARKDSLGALMDAMTRISKEKNQQDSVKGVSATVKRLTAEAANLAASGSYQEARKILDTAYDMAKLEVEKLRGGDTLVRSLNFANKEEEYEYELDRNDTHRMLVTVLLQEKRSNKSIDDMVKKYMGKADVLRNQAESQADRKDYESAVTTLEASTKEIVRAIRSAGIYIPG